MVFVNEKLTAEQRKEFKARGIKNPTINSSMNFLDTIYWTIDRENDMCLVEAGAYIDAWDERYFVFFWKGEQHVISLILDLGDEDSNTLIWKKEIDLSPYRFSINDPFVPDLKEALRVFKVFGEPSEMLEDTKVIMNF